MKQVMSDYIKLVPHTCEYFIIIYNNQQNL